MTASLLDGLTPVGQQQCKLHELVAEQLGGQIVQGALLPGEQLPREQDLSAALGVSRTVLRSALTVLEAKGLIEIRHGSCTVVRPPALWDLVDDEVLRWIRLHGRPLSTAHGTWQGIDLHKSASQFADAMYAAAPELHANPVFSALVRNLCAAGYSDAPLVGDPLPTTAREDRAL
jgi:DNA-binding transcriptional MocR family regulator